VIESQLYIPANAAGLGQNSVLYKPYLRRGPNVLIETAIFFLGESNLSDQFTDEAL
jgi:hypothetical protein